MSQVSFGSICWGASWHGKKSTEVQKSGEGLSGRDPGQGREFLCFDDVAFGEPFSRGRIPAVLSLFLPSLSLSLSLYSQSLTWLKLLSLDCHVSTCRSLCGKDPFRPLGVVSPPCWLRQSGVYPLVWRLFFSFLVLARPCRLSGVKDMQQALGPNSAMVGRVVV